MWAGDMAAMRAETMIIEDLATIPNAAPSFALT
jgi:hypothetical protein